MLTIISMLVIVLFVILIATSVAQKNKKTKTVRQPIKPKRILTMNEQPTFLRLKEALVDHHILAQVSFNALMTAQGYATRNTFNRKVADFVVLDQKFNIVAIVELDDASHKDKTSQDAMRDQLIREAGYKVIRYTKTPSIERIRSDFESLKLLHEEAYERNDQTKQDKSDQYFMNTQQSVITTESAEDAVLRQENERKTEI